MSSDLASTLNDFHQRLLTGSPTATHDLFQLAFGPIKGFLRNKYPTLDDDRIHDIATDSILSYLADTAKFDPVQSSLWSYLCMAANGDALDAIKKQLRQQELLSQGAQDVEEWSARANDFSEVEVSIDARAILSAHSNRIAVNQTERDFLALILQGERSTDAYAKALDLDPASTETKGLVKQVKDRLLLRLKRLRDEL